MKKLATILLAALLCGQLPAAHSQESSALPLDQALKRATVEGKYRMLLRMIKIPGDRSDFSAFSDFGFSTESACAGYTDLPRGYWVYVYPYWYIWRDRVTGSLEKRAWGPEQATGRPDTPEPGDQQTAWASRTPDGSDEWLMLEYKTPVTASAVHVYETFNPGAVVRITAFTLDDREIEVWRRARPVIPATPGYIFRPAFSKRLLTNRIKIYLDSRSVPGWNEIDAVGLRDESGGLQWATAAHAGSTYGVEGESTDPRDERIRQLEEQIRQLQAELQSYRRKAPQNPPPSS